MQRGKLKSRLFLVAVTATCLSCTQSVVVEPSARTTLSEEWHSQRMIVVEAPPPIVVDQNNSLDTARQSAERINTGSLAARQSSRLVRVDALPYLTGSFAGQAFLRADGARALARGTPHASCPAVGLALGPKTPENVRGKGALAGEALAICTGNLPKTGATCGCQLIALNDLVTVRREDLSYATGTTARLSIPSRGQDRFLVAEEVGQLEVLLRDLTGPVASVVTGPRGQATITFVTGEVFEGTHIPVGFRRGRLAERIYATDDSGARLSLLIGFEPDELAESAAAWLAWPKGG